MSRIIHNVLFVLAVLTNVTPGSNLFVWREPIGWQVYEAFPGRMFNIGEIGELYTIAVGTENVNGSPGPRAKFKYGHVAGGEMKVSF